MHFTEFGKNGHARMSHDGIEHELSISDWHHPPKVAGYPELGLDETLLVSPEVEDENGRHTVFVPVHGDPHAQRLHVLYRVHHGKKNRTHALAEVRQLAEGLGGRWHLTDDGELHAAPMMPHVPPEEERSQPAEPQVSRQDVIDLMTRVLSQLPPEETDGDRAVVRE